MQASLKASERVGWAWQVLARSSELAPYSTPMTASEIISPAPGPIIWAPRSLSVFFSARILTIPSVLVMALALELAKKGKTPLTYSISGFNKLNTLCFKFLFSISYDGDFWISVNDWWNGMIIDVWMFVSKVLNSKDSFFFSFMGQHSTSNNVSNTINMWNVSLQSVINNDSSFFINLDSSLVQVKSISVWSSSSWNQDMFSFQNLLFTSLYWFNDDLAVSSVIFSWNDFVWSHNFQSLFC